ncbi:TonB family protein [Marinilabiliaceae bacterium JC017]|nr:TonB family protein [Marinilabiliaceae bacterium JC017]
MKKVHLFMVGLFLVLGFSLSIEAKNSLTSLKQDSVYSEVDKLPVLKRSKGSYSAYFKKVVKYPPQEKLKGIEGDVFVSFVVGSDGNVYDVSITKGLNTSMDEEAIRVVSKSGPWKPGKKNKQNVNTQLIIPINFSLSPIEKSIYNQLRVFEQKGIQPLFVLDGKVVDENILLEDYNVESVRVIKGEKAVKLYGKIAEYGVVVITSKRGTPPVY